MTQTTPGLYSVNTATGNVALANLGGNSGGIQNVAVNLNLANRGGSLSGDFSTQIDFSNAVIGPAVDQVEFHVFFADTSYSFDVYDNSIGTTNLHVWNGVLSCATAVTATGGTFSIARTGLTVSGFFDGNAIFSVADNTAVTGIDFVLQNQPGSSDPTSVAFDNFSLTAAAVPEASTATMMLGGLGLLLAADARRQRRRP